MLLLFVCFFVCVCDVLCMQCVNGGKDARGRYIFQVLREWMTHGSFFSFSVHLNEQSKINDLS